MLAPGFVDAHTHLEWALLGDLVPGDGGFGRWLGALLARIAMLPAGHHAVAARLGALRAVQAGTTTLADNGPTGAGVAALTEAGLRGTVHLEAFGSSEDVAAARAAAVAARAASLASEAGLRVAVGVSPHAPYSAGPAMWRELAARADTAAMPWTTHLAESPDEERVLAHGDGPLADALAVVGARAAEWPAPDGATPVARLAAAGALRPGLIAAHAVRLGPADPGLLAAAGVAVAHCPLSNAVLRCGRMPLAALRAAGVVVGLGTDSPSSGGRYDLRAEARACGLLHAADGDRAPGAAELVRLMTAGGADAIGRPDLGRLAPGAPADLVAVRPPAEALPGDPAAALLHPGARVEAVWVDGEPLLEDGRALRVDARAVETAAAGARRALC